MSCYFISTDYFIMPQILKTHYHKKVFVYSDEIICNKKYDMIVSDDFNYLFKQYRDYIKQNVIIKESFGFIIDKFDDELMKNKYFKAMVLDHNYFNCSLYLLNNLIYEKYFDKLYKYIDHIILGRTKTINLNMFVIAKICEKENMMEEFLKIYNLELEKGRFLFINPKRKSKKEKIKVINFDLVFEKKI